MKRLLAVTLLMSVMASPCRADATSDALARIETALAAITTANAATAVEIKKLSESSAATAVEIKTLNARVTQLEKTQVDTVAIAKTNDEINRIVARINTLLESMQSDGCGCTPPTQPPPTVCRWEWYQDPVLYYRDEWNGYAYHRCYFYKPAVRRRVCN